MRSCWKFPFECKDLRFEKTINYKAHITLEEGHPETNNFPSGEFAVPITIEPDECPPNAVKQKGNLKITLPGDMEQTKELAHSLAHRLSQQITFSQGDFTLTGFVSGEYLPDSPEEAEELGEARFFYILNFEVVEPPHDFDVNSLENAITNPLLVQFNAAHKSQSPIDCFIGLFKILEDFYSSTNRNTSLKAAFKGSNELRQLTATHLRFIENDVARQLTEAEIDKLFDELVDTRHECAHLRSFNSFGITYGDPRVMTKVEPLITPLSIISYEAIKKRNK